MNIRLYVPKYNDSVFAAVIGSGIPEPVLVTLLCHMPVHDSVLVEVEEDCSQYEVCKVYEQNLGDHESAAILVVPIQPGTLATCPHAYLLWVASSVALGLFRLVITEGVPVALEISEGWGGDWSPWAVQVDGRWKQASNEDDRISDFLVQRLARIVDDYAQDLATD